MNLYTVTSLRRFLVMLRRATPALVDYTEDTSRGRIIGALRRANGRMVSQSTLVDAMYGDREDGGPDDAKRVLHVLICRLRRQGHPIGGGGSAGGYCWEGGRGIVRAGLALAVLVPVGKALAMVAR